MTTNELKMEIHNESLHKNEAMFACHICDYKSFSRNDIVNHNSQMHITEEKKVYKISCKKKSHEECDCNGNCDNSIEKAGEPITKNNAIQNKCDECDYTAEKAATIISHVKAVHSK